MIRLLLSICEMCFLFACFSTISLQSFIDAFFIDKKIVVRDETFIVSGRCRRLLAFIVDRRCRRPTFHCLQSMSSLNAESYAYFVQWVYNTVTKTYTCSFTNFSVCLVKPILTDSKKTVFQHWSKRLNEAELSSAFSESLSFQCELFTGRNN